MCVRAKLFLNANASFYLPFENFSLTFSPSLHPLPLTQPLIRYKPSRFITRKIEGWIGGDNAFISIFSCHPRDSISSGQHRRESGWKASFSFSDQAHLSNLLLTSKTARKICDSSPKPQENNKFLHPPANPGSPRSPVLYQ